MKIFLSALSASKLRMLDGRCMTVADRLIEKGVRMRYNLMSYYGFWRSNAGLAEAVKIRDNSDAVMIDSGAHSFQKGVKVDWGSYTEKYADFIRRYDRQNVIGYFEMDVDEIIGLPAVIEMRHMLERVTDKIIPVWHRNRGVDDFVRMCEMYAGKLVSITGFKNKDIKDEQYLSFLSVAKKHGCKVHCLGMTRRGLLDKVPFDYTDSSSWLKMAIYGSIPGMGSRKVSKKQSSLCKGELYVKSYLQGMAMQDHYERKWSHECDRDLRMEAECEKR